MIKEQWLFLKDVAKLIQYAEFIGYILTGGDLYRDPRCPYGAKNSNHKARLAIDLNLFIDGVYQKTTEAHQRLGNYWEGLGPSNRWGGRWNDGNHYERLIR